MDQQQCLTGMKLEHEREASRPSHIDRLCWGNEIIEREEKKQVQAQTQARKSNQMYTCV